MHWKAYSLPKSKFKICDECFECVDVNLIKYFGIYHCIHCDNEYFIPTMNKRSKFRNLFDAWLIQKTNDYKNQYEHLIKDVNQDNEQELKLALVSFKNDILTDMIKEFKVFDLFDNDHKRIKDFYICYALGQIISDINHLWITIGD